METFHSLTWRLEEKSFKKNAFLIIFFFLKTRCSNEYRMKNYIESTNTDKQWNAREWDPCQLDVATVLSKNFSLCIIPFLSAPVKENTPCEM